MPETYYKEALRLGQKEYRACVSRGRSPCLPVLDDFLPPEKNLNTVDVGVIQVPAELIVGIKTRGRVNAFAPNFMPILEDGTEFATKWRRLCDAHLEEGIRDPVVCWEYLNRYYVQEGNKRVSVLKFFDAVNVQAQVTRILPEKTPETELYYESLAFYKVSKVNFIEFSKKGSYAALQNALGKALDEVWTEDERRQFASDFYYFRQAYEASGGKKLSTTPGDALLSYLRVYGYPTLRQNSPGEIKKNLVKMWEEVELQAEQAPIEVKTSPADEKKPTILDRILGEPTILHAAFVYDKDPQSSGWILGHETGRLHVQRALEGKILTKTYENVMDGDPLEAIEQAVRDGNRVIFTTSPRLLPASLRAAVEHPDVVIMNCSLNSSHRYVRSYYARMYEAKFIVGAIAGSLTESGRLGYVCDYPIYGQIAGINAFALGAQMTNPRSEIYLEWSSVKGAEQAAEALAARDIHYISSQETAMLSQGQLISFGLNHCVGGKRDLLAWPVWKWGVYYERILRQMLDNTVKAEYQSSSKALNYYWGMSAGVVDLRLSDKLSEGTKRLAAFLKESVCHDRVTPFVPPLRAQDGRLITDDYTLGPEQIAGMDYLVENVCGSIPSYEELSPVGKATVDSAGVWPATKIAAEAEQEREK